MRILSQVTSPDKTSGCNPLANTILESCESRVGFPFSRKGGPSFALRREERQSRPRFHPSLGFLRPLLRLSAADLRQRSQEVVVFGRRADADADEVLVAFLFPGFDDDALGQ